MFFLKPTTTSRADNWNRFGQSQQGEGGRGRGGHHHGERGGWQEGGRGGHWTPPQNRGGFRGGFGQQSYHTPHGDSVYTPRGRGRGDYNSPRGGRGNFTPRGGRGEYTPRGGRGGGGYTPTPIGQGQGYFSPQMLQDPWQDLQSEMGWTESKVQATQLKRKSGEMLQEEQSSSEDVGQKKPVAPFYRTGGDGEQERKAWERAKMMAEEEDDFDDVLGGEPEGGECLGGDIGLSDSLIPQVGDSFCERSQLSDDVKETEEDRKSDITQS